MEMIATIGLDVAKNVFKEHSSMMSGMSSLGANFAEARF